MDEKQLQQLNRKGLSKAEAERLTKEGKSNVLQEKGRQTVASIIIGNTCTYFNAIFFGLAILVIAVGSFKSLMFMPVVIANMVIGIVQQLRAKKVLDSLKLLDTTQYTVIRDGHAETVDSDKLVLGDLILLSSGQQIPADAKVVEGKISANEALLTGESDEIEKEPGAELMSGSFVVSGNCAAELTRVGADSYAAKLTAKAKEVKNKKSELIRDIEWIILVAGILIIPVGGGILYEAIAINHHTLQESVVSMVGAVVGMIPEGLYLLLTIALTLSASRLAKNKVMLHDMKSIETLARVDVLCVDKTGTITNDVMSVTAVIAPDGCSDEQLKEAEGVLSNYVHTVPDANITMVALRKHYTEEKSLAATAVMPFSSKTKYSQVQTKDALYRFGAPEFLLTEEQLEINRARIEEYTGKGQRVLALVKGDSTGMSAGTEPQGGADAITTSQDDPAMAAQNMTATAAASRDDASAALQDDPSAASRDVATAPILFISLANEIRETAPATFSYFKEQGVKVKVISGDNPLTVSRVALEAKIDGAENYVDAATLKTERDYREAVKKYTVFGRVKPEQKKRLVEALKANGEKVAMTGDGVNDILAMKEADCSIAMGGGSDAARQAAQVVLMDSDFSHMEQIVTEGRRIINNITRSSILFLYKNIFSLLLAVFVIAAKLHYPLTPSQIALISGFLIGIPGFLLAMENNTKKQKGRLLTKTLIGATPGAVIAMGVTAFFVLCGEKLDFTHGEISMISAYVLSAVGFVLIWRQIQPLNKFRLFVISFCLAGYIFCLSFFWNTFMNVQVSNHGAFWGVIVALGTAAVSYVLMRIFDNWGKKWET